jgi:hypothetical protein
MYVFFYLFSIFIISLLLDCSEDTLVAAVGIISDKGITVSVAAGNEGRVPVTQH